MICPKCGKEYNEKMTCCISCGSSLVPYDPETQQTSFEPLIPEAVTEAETVQVREEDTDLTDAASPEKISEAAEEDIPVHSSSVRSSASRAARNLCSLAVSAIMFSLIILAAASYTVRLMTDDVKISEFAEKLDVMSLPAGETVTSSGKYDIAPDATVQEAVFAMSSGTGLTREDIREIYENSTAGDFIASQLTGYADFVREGSIPEKLTVEKLKSIFSENVGLISDSMDVTLSEHDIELALSELEQAGPVLEAIAPSNIEMTFGETALTALRLFCSRPVIVGEACAAAAMLIILRVINKRAEKVLGWGGGTLLAGGSAILLTSFLCSVQVFFIGSDRFVRGIVKCVTDVINPDIYRLGGTLAVVGAVMLLWAATLRKSYLMKSEPSRVSPTK